MAIDESIFADYAAAQGDFGTAPTSGIAGFPQGVQQAPIAVPQAVPQIQQTPELDTLSAAKQHPVFQFYDRWKKSSPEMRKNAEMKIGLDFPGGPRDMGLPDPTADVAGEAEARKQGKEPPSPKGAWGKFMKYIDSNPQFLLDLGARLLAPRGGGQSDLGFAVGGLSQAVSAASGRRAAEAKAGLAGRKAEADIAGVEADISKTPSEIELNKSKTFKNYQEAATGNRPAAAVQVLDALTDSFWKTGGNKIYATIDEARIAAQDFIQGHGGSMQESTVKIFGQSMESLGMTLQDAKNASADAAASGNPIYASRAFDARVVKQKEANTLYTKLKSENKEAPDAAIRAFIKQQTGMVPEVGGEVVPVPPKAKPTLRGALAEASKPKKAKVSVTQKLRTWLSMTRPGGSGMIDMTPMKAKAVVAEIERDFGGYSPAEQTRAMKLVKKLETKFK